MKSAYIYPFSRIKALETFLLNENQIERLLSAGNMTELQKVLQDTFLASRLTTDTVNLTDILEEELIATKQLIDSISPEKELTDILWLEYDFFNLKTIIKGAHKGLSDDEILTRCSRVGIYSPETLLAAHQNDRVGEIHPQFTAVALTANSAAYSLRNMEVAADKAYLLTAQAIAYRLKHSFARTYIDLRIDLFNLCSILRAFSVEEHGDNFIPSSKTASVSFKTASDVYAELQRFGSEGIWKDAIEHHKHTGDYSLIERAVEMTTVQFLHNQARVLPSPAVMFSYFETKKRDINLIYAVIVAKEAGLPEAELRKITRDQVTQF